MLELRNEVNQVKTEEEKRFKSDLMIKLERLQKEIIRSRGKKRERAIEAYRELLLLLKDEPIYLRRY